MNILSHKKTILILILILITFFAYWFLFLSKKDVIEGLNKNLKTQDMGSYTKYDKDFVSSLLGLNSVNLDVSIFESKTYQALNYPDKPFEIVYPKELGRQNPFLPIGIDNNSSLNTQSQNKTEVSASSTSPSASTQSTTATTSNPKPIPKAF